MYYMRFNGKFNIFKHRFKQETEFHRVEDIGKYDIQNHFLNAWNFYQLYADSAEAPW